MSFWIFCISISALLPLHSPMHFSYRTSQSTHPMKFISYIYVRSTFKPLWRSSSNGIHYSNVVHCFPITCKCFRKMQFLAKQCYSQLPFKQCQVPRIKFHSGLITVSVFWPNFISNSYFKSLEALVKIIAIVMFSISNWWDLDKSCYSNSFL